MKTEIWRYRCWSICSLSSIATFPYLDKSLPEFQKAALVVLEAPHSQTQRVQPRPEGNTGIL
jgi:hypothetical protein